MMFRRKTLAAVAAAVALSLAAAGCGGGSDNPSSSTGGTSTPGVGGTLTLGVTIPATTFKAADINFANESPYGQAVYDSLLREKTDGTPVPSLATEWKYNDDNTVLSMTLRDDVTFTDGTKFDASVAAQNLERFKDGASPNKSFLASMKEAKAVDVTHLEITLSSADPGFIAYLSKNAGMQASPKSFGAADEATNPVGSGPFILDMEKTVVGSSYEFNKNPKYWDPASQHYDKLVLKVFNDPTAMLNAVKGNQLNGAKFLNNNDLDQIKGAGYSLLSWEQDWWGLILYDRGGKVNPALGKLEVRQAINMAFDRPALLEAVAKGHGTATAQVFPENSPAFDPALDSKYPYDPAAAKKLLAEAGYPNGFTLDMPSTTRLGTAIFTLVAQQLADIGITANFTDVGTNYISDMLASKYSAAVMALQQDPSWQLINFKITPASTWNPFKVEDPKIDELVSTIHNAKTDAEAAPAYKELGKYIVDQAWFAPWYRVESNYALDAKTEGAVQAGNAYPYLLNFKPKG